MKENKLLSALNSNIVILVLGFLLTGVVGAWLSDRFQEASWRRQAEFEAQRRAYEWDREKTFELLRYRLKEGLGSLEKISDTMNKRLFRMERVYNTLSGAKVKPDSQVWKDYRDAVDEWNIKLKYYEEDLKRLVGEEFAIELNNYETDRYAKLGRCPEQPKDIPSIHGKFWCSNKNLNKLRECSSCPERMELLRDTAALIRELNFQTDAFIARVGNEFLDRSSELKQFKFHPATEQSAPNKAIQPTSK